MSKKVNLNKVENQNESYESTFLHGLFTIHECKTEIAKQNSVLDISSLSSKSFNAAAIVSKKAFNA